MTEGMILRSARQKVGLTQEAISSSLGFKSAQYISNVERDKCPLNPQLFVKIAKLVGKQAMRSLVRARIKCLEKELMRGLR